MSRKVGLFVLITLLLLVFISPVFAQAQGGITVTSQTTTAQFPLLLQFNLTASSDTNITDIRLRYTVGRESFARVTSEIYAEFAPATMVNISSTLEMIKIGGLPSGASVEYWWVLKDARGNRLETKPAKVQFNDSRYTWQKLTEGMVTLYWYNGSQSFAQELMTASQQALSRLAKDTGAQLSKPVSFYIYASPQDLQGAMIFPQEWTGGVAFTEFGIIAIGIAPNNLDWGKGAISHELAHMVNYQMTSNPYSGLPTWLEEGLAKYAEGPMSATDASMINQALARNGLISVRTLSSPFSSYSELALLAYAESRSVVDFLISNYGQAKMFELLNTFKNGSTYDNAFKKVYGFDMDGLNITWMNYLSRKAPSAMRDAGHPEPVLVLAGGKTW